MATQIYPIHRSEHYRKAGPSDLIELLPAPGAHPLFLPRNLVETLVYAIVRHEFIHLSGPTGSAKSSLLEALSLEPTNFQLVCENLGFPAKPLKLYPIEMAIYEAPGELYQRRALQDGTTYDELSTLVVALEEAARSGDSVYPLIWLREMGRVHSATVQGGLLNLMTRNEILLPGGPKISGQNIAWVADSNYQAEQESNHTLVQLDDALKRRFSINLTLEYLSATQEVQVLEYLAEKMEVGNLDPELISNVVRLGQTIRNHRMDGNLQSLVPPTIYGYMAFLRMAAGLPNHSLQQIALCTLLGNAGLEDKKLAHSVLNEVFGLQSDELNEPAGGKLF